MKHTVIPLLLSAAMLLTGCSGSTIYTNYRNTTSMEIIHAVGVDLTGDGVAVNAATSVGEDGKAPKIYKQTADSFAAAVSLLRRLPVERNAFFPHTQHIIIGEAAAADGIAGIMDYMERATEMRIDTNIFIVKGGTAEELMLDTTTKESSCADMLTFLKRDVIRTGTGFVPDCGDVASALSGTGITLIAAVTPTESSDMTSDEESSMIKMVGFAVVKNGVLSFFVPDGEARGVTVLKNKLEYATTVIPDGLGGSVTLGITSADTDIKPVYENDSLSRIDVNVDITTDIIQMDNYIDVDSDSVRKMLAEEAAKAERDRICDAISLSQEKGVDFIGFKGIAERDSPGDFEKIKDGWDELFPDIPVYVTVSASVKRTFDLHMPMPVDGGGVGHGTQ